MGIIHFEDKEGYNILVLFLKTSSCLILLEGEFLVYKQMAYTVALNISIIKIHKTNLTL